MAPITRQATRQAQVSSISKPTRGKRSLISSRLKNKGKVRHMSLQQTLESSKETIATEAQDKMDLSEPKPVIRPTEASSLPIYFYRTTSPYGFFSQWYASPFTETFRTTITAEPKTVSFANAEQYMMYCKALLFAPDSEITEKILQTTSPRALKALGRQVPNFKDAIWVARRLGIVSRGSLLKFSQDEELKRLLLETGERLLVEAAPRDRIWGIGYGEENAEKWRGVEGKWGKNLLGKALMEARDVLRKVEEGKAEIEMEVRLDEEVAKEMEEFDNGKPLYFDNSGFIVGKRRSSKREDSSFFLDDSFPAPFTETLMRVDTDGTTETKEFTFKTVMEYCKFMEASCCTVTGSVENGDQRIDYCDPPTRFATHVFTDPPYSWHSKQPRWPARSLLTPVQEQTFRKRGNLLKLRQHPELKKELLATGERNLVYITQYSRDPDEGIGHHDAKTAEKYRGILGKWRKNLRGKMIMEIRDELRNESSSEFTV